MHIFKLFLKGLEKFWTKTAPAPGNRAFHEREKEGGSKPVMVAHYRLFCGVLETY
jgi:hypothetical protein